MLAQWAWDMFSRDHTRTPGQQAPLSARPLSSVLGLHRGPFGRHISITLAEPAHEIAVVGMREPHILRARLILNERRDGGSMGSVALRRTLSLGRVHP